MKKTFFSAFGHLMMTMLMTLMGVGNAIAMGTANIEGGVGSVDPGRGGAEAKGGLATKSEGEQIADPDWYEKFIDNEVTKIQPTSTPLLQLVSYAKKVSGNSTVVKYYTNGYRPYKTYLKTAFNGMTSGTSDRVTLDVADPKMFSVDDTILVIGVKGYEADGTTQSNRPLMLIVCDINSSSGLPSVFAANGKIIDESDNILVPAIPVNTKLLRMGKAAGEVDSQTGEYYSLPRARENQVQKFMCQVEQSTVNKLSKKEVDNWSWSDVEEDAIVDMKRGMEFSFLWGVKSTHAHASKKGNIWTCDGVWDMAAKEIQVGTVSGGKDVITDDDLVDVLKDLYAGTSLGGKQKILLCGSDFLAALSKIKSERLIYRDSVEKYGLKFKSFDSEFGELLAIHAEVLNAAEKSKWAFAFDPDYLRKYTFRSWSRNVIDKNAIGVSETEAAIIREMSCCYLKYGPAHARLFLASVASVTGATNPTNNETVAAKFDNKIVKPVAEA